MNQLQEALLASSLDQAVRDDLVLLAPELSQIEQLRIKKAIELNAFQLLTLLPLKYKSKIKQLREALQTEIQKTATMSETDGERVKLDEKNSKQVQHTAFNFDEFSWSKLVEQIEQLRPNDIAVASILKSASYLGSGVARLPNTTTTVSFLESIDSLKDLRQLGQLDTLHVSFLLEDNADQKILLFKEKLNGLFGKASDVTLRRAYFLLFLRSPLFFKYTFTGLTALNLKTDLPRKTLLNVLHQNDERFLNLTQFELTAKLVKTIRSVVII